ncbi:MAG: flagellar biosynthesis protein FliQ [Planctomycetaceae bacterium]|nr:flagellar biosynthesis protein FliQ [Planctomycetaceae bacterium]
MSVDHAAELCQQAVITALLLGLPVMAAALIVGLITSIGQAVTQLQDQTLGFVPKIIAMLAMLLFTLPWTLHALVEYATNVFENIPGGM